MKEFCKKAGIFLLIFGVIFLFVFRTNFQIMFAEPVDIFVDAVDSDEDLKVGLAINTDMYLLMESFASKDTTNRGRGGRVTSTSTDYYYILPVFVGAEDTYYVAFKVGEHDGDKSKYNQIANDTMAYLYGEQDTCGNYSVWINGGLHKLENEGYQYMKDWFRENGFFENEADIEKYVLPLCFEKQSDSAIRGIFMFSVGAVVVGIVLIIVSTQIGNKYKARHEYLQGLYGRTVTINNIPYEIANMEELDKLLMDGKTAKAKKLLMKSFRASDQEADYIINNWSSITGTYMA